MQQRTMSQNNNKDTIDYIDLNIRFTINIIAKNLDSAFGEEDHIDMVNSRIKRPVYLQSSVPIYQYHGFKIGDSYSNNVNRFIVSVNINGIIQLLDWARQNFPGFTKFIGLRSSKNTKMALSYNITSGIHNKSVNGSIYYSSPISSFTKLSENLVSINSHASNRFVG